MSTPRSRILVAASRALALAACLFWAAPSAFAQEKPKDDLDRLLENIEKKEKAPEAKADEKKADEPKDKDKDKDKDKEKKPEVKKTDDKKPKGGVEDKDLDDLLGKLGGTPDSPDAKGKPMPMPPAGGPGGEPMPPGESKKDGGLDDDQKKIDDDLATRAGKIRKPKNQQQQGQGQGQGQGQEGGPLGEAIKQMKEVEERLGKTDTGEKTREEQKEIVKKLDTILQQLRRQQGQGRQMAQGGQQQGTQPGEQPNPNPNKDGVGPQKPKTPTLKEMMGNDKQPWGNLPSSLRQDIANIAKEEPLDGKKSLIQRYFLSVTKKSATKE